MDELNGCYNCKYSHEFVDYQDDEVMCRRYPPVSVIIPEDKGDLFMAWSFPSVGRYCYCGEWTEIDKGV